ARAGQVTNDAFGGLEAAVAVTPAQLLGSLALLLEVEVEARIACFGHETTFHSSGVRFAGWKTVRGRMSIEGSRRAQPFPRTGRTLEGAGVSIARSGAAAARVSPRSGDRSGVERPLAPAVDSHIIVVIFHATAERHQEGGDPRANPPARRRRNSPTRLRRRLGGRHHERGRADPRRLLRPLRLARGHAD